MNFSELFKQSSQLCRFSPDGRYLANVVQYRVIVRDVKTLQILHLYTCLDAVQQLEWSCDSSFLLCGMHKRGLVQAWSLEHPDWTCKIDEGSAGLLDVCWSPDGRHILTTAEFHLRVTVWSLVNKSVSYIKYPKSCQKGLDFSHNGKYLALAERRDCKDFVSIFDCNSWHLIKHIETETEDLAGVQWSPDSLFLAVWESCLLYKVLLYSIDGRRLATFSAYDYALGVKTLSWAPSSQFLAIGSFDQKVRLLNHITWSMIVEFSHTATVNGDSTVVYKEVVTKTPLLQGEKEPPVGLMYAAPSKYEVIEGSISVPVVKSDMNKANPRIGVGLAEFSSDCRYLYTRNDNQPTALWIWDIIKLKPAVVLLQESPIRFVAWDPRQARLAMCTGSNKIYMWSPAGCLSVEVPAEGSFQVQGLQWHPSGSALLLTSRDEMCMCFLVDDQ